MLLFLSAFAGAVELPRLLNFGPSASISLLLLLLLLWKPMTCTELLWATVEAGGAGGLPLVATNDLSMDVERCIEMREPDEDRSADEQRAGRGGLEAVTLYPLPDVRNGLLYDLLMVE